MQSQGNSDRSPLALSPLLSINFGAKHWGQHPIYFFKGTTAAVLLARPTSKVAYFYYVSNFKDETQVLEGSLEVLGNLLKVLKIG